MTVGVAGYGQKRVEKPGTHEPLLYSFLVQLSHFFAGFFENLTVRC
jgi:hypothetical protein